MRKGDISPEQILSQNIIPVEETEIFSNFQKSLENLKNFQCIQKLEDGSNTIDTVNTLVQKYLESKVEGNEDGESQVLFSQLEKVNEIIQTILCRSLEKNRLYWKDHKKPKFWQWAINRKKILSTINDHFEDMFDIREATVWNHANGPESTRSASISTLRKRMTDIDFILKTWNQFYLQEKKLQEKNLSQKEWKSAIPLGKMVLDIRIRVRKQLS